MTINDYRRTPQLPEGLDEQHSPLQVGGASGSNWRIADGHDFRKRPGLRPVIAQPPADSTASAYASASNVSLREPKGVIAAAEYVVGNQMRQKSFDKLTSATDTMYVYNDTQIVCIIDGRPFVIRKIPVLKLLKVAGYSYSYRFGTNSLGALEFSVRNMDGDIVSGDGTPTTITSSTTLTDLVSGFYNVVKVVDTLYTRAWSTSRIPGLGGQLASCIVPTPGSTWLNLDENDQFIYGYVPFEMPISNPTGDSTVYRCFYTQDTSSRDGNVVGVQFQEEMLFTGKGDALMCFDGYRMSVAGCNTGLRSLTVTRDATAGGLTPGVYSYIARPKLTRPSGQVSYGPVIPVKTGTSLGADSMAVSLNFNENEFAKALDYSGVAAAPKRYNALPAVNFTAGVGTTFDLSTDSLNRVMPLVGETVSRLNVNLAATTNNSPLRINSVVGNTVTVELLGTSGATVLNNGYFSLGEDVDIFRTAAGGTVYYLIQSVPLRYMNTFSFLDQTGDAALVANPSYIAKPYAISAPPDCCNAVVAHQNRVVVVGEYRSNFDNQFYYGTSAAVDTRRPFIRNVYWSQPNNEEFSPTNNVILDVTEGGELNSCLSVHDTLYIGGGESMWVIQGSLGSATSYTVSRVPGASGTVGNTAICALNGQVYAVSRAGLYSMNGGSADYSAGTQVNAIIRRVTPELSPFIRLVALKKNAGLALIIPGMVFSRPAVKVAAGDEVFPSSFVATEDATDTITLILDPNTQTWSQWSGTDMYMGGGLVEFDGQTWAFPRKDGIPISVLDDKYGYDGFSTPIEMVVKGPWQHDEDLFTDKNFIRLRVICAAPGKQNFVLRTKIERNWVENQYAQEFDLSFKSGEGYGQQSYGSYPYGSPNEAAKQAALTNQKALSVRAVFENSNPAEFPSISGWNFEIAENRKNMKQE